MLWPAPWKVALPEGGFRAGWRAKEWDRRGTGRERSSRSFGRSTFWYRNRRGLVAARADPKGARTRWLRLADDGRALLAAALPVWRAEQDRVDDALPAPEVALDLDLLTGGIRQMGSLDRTAGDAEASDP